MTKLRGKAKGLEKWKATKAYRTLHEPSLTPTEKNVFDELRMNGWYVLRSGWPDLLAEKDGEIRLIEVKCEGDKLSTVQKRMHRHLARLGIQVEVITVPKDQGRDRAMRPQPSPQERNHR